MTDVHDLDTPVPETEKVAAKNLSSTVEVNGDNAPEVQNGDHKTEKSIGNDQIEPKEGDATVVNALNAASDAVIDLTKEEVDNEGDDDDDEEGALEEEDAAGDEEEAAGDVTNGTAEKQKNGRKRDSDANGNDKLTEAVEAAEPLAKKTRTDETEIAAPDATVQ